jgi:CheY-like chemotaxis protein
MDDEESIRELLAAVLENSGFEVVFAADGEEAVRRYREALDAGTPPVGVILDLTIPGGMGGKDAVRKLLEIDPAAKAVVSSGYALDPAVANYREHGFRGVLAKPFKIEELEAVIREVFS